MTFKTQLFAAFERANGVRIDGYKLEHLMREADTVLLSSALNYAPSVRCLDQEITIVEGLAFFQDCDGHEHTAELTTMRPLQAEDMEDRA